MGNENTYSENPNKLLAIKLTFAHGKRVEFDDYSIGIPDGFELKKNVNGRDFVIWMPPTPGTEDADEIDEDGVPIMSRIVFMETAVNDELPCEAIQLLHFKKIYAYATAAELIKQNMFSSLPIILATKDIAAFYQQTLMSNYSLKVVFSEYMKVFACRLDPALEPSSEVETAFFEEMLSSWVNTIQLKNPYPVRKALDDPYFFEKGLTKDAISEWGKYAADWSNQSTFLCTQAIQYEVYRYNANHPVWSFAVCKPKLTAYLKWEVDYYNKMLAEVQNCLERLRSSSSKESFSFLCKQALELASIDRCSRTFGNDEIKLNTDAPKIRKRIKELSQQIVPKPIINELNQVETQKQQDKQSPKLSAKSVRKNLEAELQHRIGAIEQAATMKVTESKSRLAKAMQDESKRLEQEIALAKTEVDSISDALGSMRIFQFKQKADAKAKLQQLHLQIEQLDQKRRNPDSADIQQAKVALNRAEAELAKCSVKRKKWDDAVNAVCLTYEKRLKLHLDYAAGKELNLLSKIPEPDRKYCKLMRTVYMSAYHSTISEIIETTPELHGYDNMFVAAVARRMIQEGYLSKTVLGGKTYLDGEKCPPELIDDTDWDITIPPAVPNADSIFLD